MTGTTHAFLNRIRLSDWIHLKSEFVWIYEGAIEQRYRDKKQHHPGQSALLLQQGSMRIQTETTSVEAGEGHWIFPQQGPRWQRFSEDARVLSIHFELYWPGGQPLFDWDGALILDAASIPQLEKQSRILHRLVQRLVPGANNFLPGMQASLSTHLTLQRAFDSWLLVYAKTLLDSGLVPSRLAQIDERMLAAVQMLDNLPLETVFDESWLAAKVELSPSQLDRLFSRHFNMTPRQYFDRRKLQQAVKLINSAPLSIKQITYELGFYSLPSFSRWFKKQTGLSPRQFKTTGKKNHRRSAA